MAEAICRLWPEAKLVYGPTVTDGFYYDIDLDEPIRPEDFEKIEQEMAAIVKANEPIVRIEMNRQEALAKMAGDPYKLDNIQRAEGESQGRKETARVGNSESRACERKITDKNLLLFG